MGFETPTGYDHEGETLRPAVSAPEELSVGTQDTKVLESGTVIPTGTITAFSRTVSTTSFSSNEPSYMSFRWPYSDLVVGELEPVMLLSCDVYPGTGETARINLKNTTEGDTVTSIEISGVTESGTYTSDNGWAAYTPSTTNAPVAMLSQIYTDPGNNSTTFAGLTVYMGVRVP